MSFFSCAAKFYFISLQLPPVPAQARTYLSMRPNNSIPSLPRSTSLFAHSLIYLFLTSVSLTLSLPSPSLSLTPCVSLFFSLYSLPFFSSLFFSSKGCGIVEFSCPEEAQRAMIELNDTEFMGRQVFIREDREEGGGGGR